MHREYGKLSVRLVEVAPKRGKPSYTFTSSKYDGFSPARLKAQVFVLSWSSSEISKEFRIRFVVLFVQLIKRYIIEY